MKLSKAGGAQWNPTSPPQHRLRRALGRGVACLVLGYVVVLGLLMIFEENFIFFPLRYPGGDWDPQGLEFQDVSFEAADATRLHGWYSPIESPECVLLVSHGNAGNITHRASLARIWQHELHASVFMYDYRGYGKSQGKPSEQGLYEDARGAYRWLAAQEGVDPSNIVLLGHSLGGAVALQLALEVPHRSLILESTFTSLVDMGRLQFPWFPLSLVMRNRFDSQAKIGRYHGPVVITHGRLDTVVPVEMAERLYGAANQPRLLRIVPHGDHDATWLDDPEYFPAIRDFLDAHRSTQPIASGSH